MQVNQKPVSIAKTEIVSLTEKESVVTLVIANGPAEDLSSELLHIHTRISHSANPRVSEVQKEALRRASDVIDAQIEMINNLPRPRAFE